MDDDTSLPSMRSLVETLGSYDSSQEWYLGGMSEDWWSVMVYGMTSFGGGGTFLSITLASRIDANHDTCVRETYANQGDIRIFECITRRTTTKLQPVPRLYQMDLGGELSGFLRKRPFASFVTSLEGGMAFRAKAGTESAEYVTDGPDASCIRHLR